MTEPDSDSCRPVEIDGEIIRVRGSGDMSTESQAALAEVIRAAKRRFAAEHPARLTVDTITSDQLDALQDRVVKAEAELLDWKKLLQKSRDMTAAHWAAIERVRDLHARWLSDGAPPIGTSIARWWDKRLIQLAAALDEPKEPTPPTFTLLHHACGQLADIPGDVTLHSGRLSWPGHDCPADTSKEPTS